MATYLQYCFVNDTRRKGNTNPKDFFSCNNYHHLISFGYVILLFFVMVGNIKSIKLHLVIKTADKQKRTSHAASNSLHCFTIAKE